MTIKLKCVYTIIHLHFKHKNTMSKDSETLLNAEQLSKGPGNVKYVKYAQTSVQTTIMDYFKH